MSSLPGRPDIAVRPELLLFDRPPVDSCIEDECFLHVLPDSSIEQGGMIVFTVPASLTYYTDLSESRLTVRVQLTDVGSDDGVKVDKLLLAPANQTLHTMFQDVQLLLNGELVEGGDYLNHYRSYFTTLLDYGEEDQETLLTSWGFAKETGNLVVDSANAGYATRVGLLSEKKKLTLRGKLPLAFAYQGRFLLPGITLGFKLQPSTPTWLLMMKKVAEDHTMPTRPRLKIESAQLMIRRVRPEASVLAAHEAGLRHQPALYPVRMCKMTVHSLASGSQSESIERVFPNPGVPTFLLMGFVTNKAFTGDYSVNPLKLENLNHTFLSTFVDGRAVPTRPLHNVTDALDAEEYDWFVQQVRLGWSPSARVGITPSEYKQGYTLYAFCLGGGGGPAGAQSHVRTGNLSIQMRFASALTSAYNVIILGVFDQRILITADRTVYNPDR